MCIYNTCTVVAVVMSNYYEKSSHIDTITLVNVKVSATNIEKQFDASQQVSAINTMKTSRTSMLSLLLIVLRIQFMAISLKIQLFVQSWG